MTDYDADVLIVGSGPAGAQAARGAVGSGLRVLTVDVGFDDRTLAESIPPLGFTQLRAGDAEQRRYLLGELREDDLAGVKAGAQLTPPRAHLTRDVAALLPLESTSFRPILSLARGGLGAAWGGGSATFTARECALAGLDHAAIRAAYQEVAADIGISGGADDDIAENMTDIAALQPPVESDSNGRSILATYTARRTALRARGLTVGRPPMAMLSRPLDGSSERAGNPLLDMDLYNDCGRSVYRPWMTIDALSSRENYRYRDRLLALSFETSADGVALWCRDLRSGERVRITTRRLLLAAGAINSARLVLTSLGGDGVRTPLLCNAYRYVAAVNLTMLGRPAADARHSLAQLAATFSREPDDPRQLFLSLYSYRSLLLYRLIKEMPLPPRLGLLTARLLLSSLVIVGVHFPDEPSSGKWLSRLSGDESESGILRAEYEPPAAERHWQGERLRALLRTLPGLRLLPLSCVDPGYGSSIHYAGTIPFSDRPERFAARPDGELYAAPGVYLADSAAWRFLPAKGPTVTIMANARVVAASAVRSLGVSL